jgi:putative GTP pyrophosphokinase
MMSKRQSSRRSKDGVKKPRSGARGAVAGSAPASAKSSVGNGVSTVSIAPALREDAFKVPGQEEFFKRFHLSEAALTECELTWSVLAEIAKEYLATVDGRRHTGNYVAERLRALESVHSVSVRIKDPSHLMEKIVRKKRETPSREITLENYESEITDLIGIRALHLFKAEWQPVHQFIEQNWGFVEKPTANVREGDPRGLIEMFQNEGCEICEHPAGYRSVHYLIKSQPTKETVIVELQVRTIFEEGWSEIDHRVRYPYETDNTVLGELLEVFNRLAGSADEMGSFVQSLKETLARRDHDAVIVKANYEETVRTLKEQVAQLNIDARAKRELEKRVRELETRSTERAAGTIAISSGNDRAFSSISSLGLRSRADSEVTISRSLVSSPTVLNRDSVVVGLGAPKCVKCGAAIGGGLAFTYPYCSDCRPSTISGLFKSDGV